MFETTAQIWWCKDIKVSNNLYHVLQSSMNPNTLQRLPVVKHTAKCHAMSWVPRWVQWNCDVPPYSPKGVDAMDLLVGWCCRHPWKTWTAATSSWKHVFASSFLLRVMGEILKKTVQDWSTRRHTKLWKSSTERFFNTNHWLGAKRKKARRANLQFSIWNTEGTATNHLHILQSEIVILWLVSLKISCTFFHRQSCQVYDIWCTRGK